MFYNRKLKKEIKQLFKEYGLEKNINIELTSQYTYFFNCFDIIVKIIKKERFLNNDKPIIINCYQYIKEDLLKNLDIVYLIFDDLIKEDIIEPFFDNTDKKICLDDVLNLILTKILNNNDLFYLPISAFLSDDLLRKDMLSSVMKRELEKEILLSNTSIRWREKLFFSYLETLIDNIDLDIINDDELLFNELDIENLKNKEFISFIENHTIETKLGKRILKDDFKNIFNLNKSFQHNVNLLHSIEEINNNLYFKNLNHNIEIKKHI